MPWRLPLEAHLRRAVDLKLGSRGDVDFRRKGTGICSSSSFTVPSATHNVFGEGSIPFAQLTIETSTTASPDQGWLDTAS